MVLPLLIHSKPRYTGPGDWKRQVKAGTKFGRILGGVGIGLAVIDMTQNGVNTSNSLDLFFGGVSFFGPVGAAIGGGYFVANLLTIGITGKAIGEHIDDNFIFTLSGGTVIPITIKML